MIYKRYLLNSAINIIHWALFYVQNFYVLSNRVNGFDVMTREIISEITFSLRTN